MLDIFFTMEDNNFLFLSGDSVHDLLFKSSYCLNLILQLQSFNCVFILTTLKLGKIRLVILEQHLYTVYIPVLWIRSFYLKTLCILLALWSKCLVVIELEKRCLVFFSLLLVCLNLKEECYLEVPKQNLYFKLFLLFKGNVAWLSGFKNSL